MFGGIGSFFSNLVGGNNNNNQQNNGGNLVDAARRADEERRQREEEERRRKEEERKEQERQAKIAAERQAAEQARVRQAQEQQARNAAASASIANRTSGIGDNTNAALGINTPVNQNNNRTYTSNVDELSKEFIDEERKRVNQNTGFLERTFNGGNLERIAQASAQNRAISRINEQNNYEKPEETRLALQRNMQNQSQTHQNIQNNLKTLDRVDKGMVDAYSKLQYIPGFSLGVEGVGTVGALALGDDSQVNKRLVKLTQDVDWDSLDQDQKNQVGALRNVGGLLSTLDVVPGIGAGGKVGKQSIGAFARGGFKDVAKTAAIRGAAGAVGGGVLGGALTGAFGGDVLEGASKGAIGGAVGGIIGTPFEGATAASRSARGAIGSINDTVVNNLDDTLQNSVKNADDGLTRGAVKVNPRANVDKTTIGATSAVGGDLDDSAQVAGQSPEIDIDTPAYIRKREAQAKAAAEQADFNARVEADPSMTPSFLYKRQAQSIADNANNQIRNIGEQIDYGIRTGDVTEDQIRKAIDDATFRQQQISEDAQNQIGNVFKQREADRMAGEATENLGDVIDTAASNNDIIADQIDNTIRGTTVAQDPQATSLSAQQVAEQPTPATYTASPSPEAGGIYGDTQQTPNISETLNEKIGSATTDNTGIAAQRLQQAIKGSVNQDIKKQSYNAREVAQAVNEFYDSTTPMEAASGLAGLEINGANDILAANELIQRLEKDNMTLKNPAIREAMLAAGDRISKKSSNAGSDLRATAEFHQNLPTELWIENVKRDLAESGQALTPEQETNLMSKKDALKSAAQEVRAIYRNASKLADEMGNLIRKGKMTEDMATEYDTVGKELANAQQTADRTLKIANDSLRKDLRKTSKDGAFRKSVDALSNGYRTLLLSSPSGRLADVGSTVLKSIDKLASSTVSNTIGKVANKINPEAGLRQGAGAGTAEAFARGAKRGGRRVKDIFTNQQNPDARMGETIGGLFGRGVQAMTGVAPAITEGAVDVRLLNTVRAQLKAELPNATNRQLDSMARIAAVAERGDPTSGAFNEATRYHNEINMTGTDNVISKNVDKVINKMEKQPALKAVATLTAPFARFSANSAYNTARRNPIGDLVALGKNIKDGNTQGIVDNLGELTVDTAKMAAYAAARGAGGLEDEDNDGQTYESNYIKWNDNATSPLDRVAVSDNTNATLGKSISDLQSGSDLKDVVGNALGETVNDIPGRVFDNMTNNSVARALGKLTDYRNSGGENLENTAKELSKLFNPVYNSDDTMKFGDSNISVPFASSPLGRDIRTQIDSKQSFGDRIIQNPARSEATQNRRDNEKSAANLKPGDWFSINASETKKDNGQTINKQTIDRNDGKDPSFKGDISNLQSHMKNSGYSDDQVNDAINMLSMTKNEVLRDFETNGSQNAVRRHANSYLEALRASDADTTDVRKAERFLKLAEVNEKYDVPVELQQAYNKTDLSTWRAMEEDNPELFKLLYQYGQTLADAGISKKSTESGIDSASESNTNKYYAKKSRKGSGSRSGSGGSGKGISTSVGTIKVEDNNTGVKSRSIANPKSYIPGLQKLNSTPQLKKISVKDGFKY